MRALLLSVIIYLLFTMNLYAIPVSPKLVIALNNDPPQLIPAIHSGTLPGFLGTQLFAGLVRLDRDGVVSPYLAKSWQVSADGKRVDFYLRENAFFHDGSPITAEDVLFSYKLVRRCHPFYSMLKPVTSLEVTGKHSFSLYLNAPYPALFRVCTAALFPILPRHIYENKPKLLYGYTNGYLVGSGPFYLSEYQQGEEIVLRAFPQFFLAGRPLLDELRFRIFSGPDEIEMALEGGEVQLAAFSPVLTGSGATSWPDRLCSTTEGFAGIGPMLGIEFNLRRKPFDDLRVRQAFSLALDRQFIKNNILGESAVVMDGPFLPTLPYYQSSNNSENFDVVRANELLDEAGYQRDSHGRRMQVTVIALPNARSLTRPLLEYLRYSLGRNLGIDLRIWETPDLKTWGREVSSGNFQASLDIAFTWSEPMIGLHRLYSSKNIRKGITWSNITGYHNARVDEIFQKIESGQVKTIEKMKLYREVEADIRADYPIAWLATMPYSTVYDKRLQGLNQGYWGMLSPMDEVFWGKSSEEGK